MTTGSHIPTFHTLAELYAANGLALRPATPDFHVFRLVDTYPSAHMYMPPFRHAFYQVNLLLPEPGIEFSLSGVSHRVQQPLLYFIGPAQVYTYRRGAAMQGYILYFTDDFLAQLGAPVGVVFPAFQPWQPNSLPLAAVQASQFQTEFDQLLADQSSTQPYRMERLRHGVLRLLYLAKGLLQPTTTNPSALSRPSYLAQRFQQLLEQQYLTHHAVQDYADQLAVTPGHLTEAVKSTLGQTPKQLIENRLMLEARQLLTYTQLASNEIAYRLGYADATQFGKRFRQHAGTTPAQYRQQAQALPAE